jgi:hypothetical protein
VLNGDVRLNEFYVNQNGANGFVRQDGGTVTVIERGRHRVSASRHWPTTSAPTPWPRPVVERQRAGISVAWDGAGTFTINGGTVVTRRSGSGER